MGRLNNDYLALVAPYFNTDEDPTESWQNSG